MINVPYFSVVCISSFLLHPYVEVMTISLRFLPHTFHTFIKLIILKYN